MNAAVLILGVLHMTQSESPLSLEAASAQENGKPVVIARLRNQSKEPCVVVLDDLFCQVETHLFTEKGKPLEALDVRAVLGVREPPQRLDPVKIAPGAAVDLATFSMALDHSRAIAGPLSWELQDVAGQTLKVEFRYCLPREMLERVEKLGALGALVGNWTSPKVEVPTTKLTQKQVGDVLAERRRILDAGAIPLLVKALQDAKDPIAREWAAASLGDLKAMVAASAVALALRKDPDRGVRLCAASALGSIAAPETREALTEAAEKDTDDLVRTRAKDALLHLPR
jgi:hypothetical protein